MNSNNNKQICMVLLLELLFVRESVLSRNLLSADNIDVFVDFMCIS